MTGGSETDGGSLNISSMSNPMPLPLIPVDCNATLQCLQVEQMLIFGLLYLTVIIFAIFGNVFVFWAIGSDTRMRRVPINILLINMAISDLLNVIFCLPDVIMAVEDRGWLISYPFCPILRYGQTVALYASVMTQVVVCLERYMAISDPLKARTIPNSRIYSLIIILWSISIVFALPYGVFMKVVDLPHKGGVQVCFWPEFPMRWRLIFKGCECLYFYFIPLILLTVYYTKIARLLWGGGLKNQHEFEALYENPQVAASVLLLRRGVVKTMILSVFVYFVCYSPIQYFFLASTFFQTKTYVPPTLRLFINWLTLSSGAINPLLYTIICPPFRVKFRKMTRAMSMKKASPYDIQLERDMVVCSRRPTLRDAFEMLALPARLHTMAGTGIDLPNKAEYINPQTLTDRLSRLINVGEPSGAVKTYTKYMNASTP